MKTRKPNPIKIKYKGSDIVLVPFHLPLRELERVRDWLDRVIKWKKTK